MKFNLENINKIDVNLPKRFSEKNDSNVKWAHFGPGNIFRGYICDLAQKMLDSGELENGILAIETFDKEIIEKVFKPCDNLTYLVRMDKTGEFEEKVIASISDGIYYFDEIERVKKLFKNNMLEIVSFTISEKGYNIFNDLGEVSDHIKNEDFENPKHLMAIMTRLLFERYQVNAPITLVSMDNCHENGETLKNAIIKIANIWKNKKLVDEEFIEYLQNKVSYPLSMIDKITPRPSEDIYKYLKEKDLEMDIVITEKKSYMAPFVNCECAEYLVIEDNFKNGRPKFEDFGIYMTDRDTVNKAEIMKVTTCLNPIHTAIGPVGCLFNYDFIWQTIKDEDILKLACKLGYDEGMKVVVDPKIIDPKSFLDEVIYDRFMNPFIPDTPQRIAVDASQMLNIRFGQTIKAYIKSSELDAKNLIAVPMAIALWCRYLVAIDDNGNSFELSPDPMLEELCKEFEGVKLGDKPSIKHILNNNKIFDFDIYEVLGEKIEEMFFSMMSGKGAVRETLQKWIS